MNDAFLESVGGKKLTRDLAKMYGGNADEVIWNFGWIPPELRTQTQADAHCEITAAMPSFEIWGRKDDDSKKVLLTDLWTHPQVVDAIGKPFTGIHQYTGSCVGAGGGNVLFTLTAVEVVRLNDPEKIVVPFWLLPYGRSRFYMGDRNRGEGSLGSTFAKAAKEDGLVDADLPGLPKYRENEGLSWNANDEMSWSDGDAQQTLNLLPESRKYVVKTVAPVKDADGVRESIRNLYPCTIACGKLVQRGRVQGTKQPVSLGTIDGRGGHQTSILGWMDHPDFGELFLYVNQWGFIYPDDPCGAPRVGVWINKRDMNSICAEDEVYSFSQHNGYPAQTLDFNPWMV